MELVKKHKRNPKKKVRLIFDISAIAHYIVLAAVFALVVYAVNSVVFTAINASPTNQVGNGILALYEVHNTGAAFNLFAGQTQFIVSASFVAIAVIALSVMFMSAKLNQTAISAMSSLTAGISMNLYERITHGYVIDYISLEFAKNFPVFNMADILIVVGAIGLVFSLLTRR